MTEKEKMFAGNLYMASDQELQAMSLKSRVFLDAFNQTSFHDFEGRRILAKKIFGALGKNAMINKPFYCDYGSNIYIGNEFYANFDCVILDINKVTIGDRVFLAPGVHIYTAAHPIDAFIRATGLEYGVQVTIGDDVWIGGHTVINPGVTIGSDVVIGSGSVVTKDIPSHVIAAGNPCRVIRKITKEDQLYWEKERLKHAK